MTYLELKLELLEILKSDSSMRVDWKPMKRVYVVKWKNGKHYSTGRELYEQMKTLHKAATNKTYDFSILEHGIYEKHVEIFI